MSEPIAARVRWGLLGEWWCVFADADEDECLKIIADPKNNTLPVRDPELVRDRLFGGFECHQDRRRRHVYLASGQYTYLNPDQNGPLSEDCRREKWKELIDENGEPGNGPFTHAGPA